MRKLIIKIDGQKFKWDIPTTAAEIPLGVGIEIVTLLQGKQTEEKVSKIISFAIGCPIKTATYLIREHLKDASNLLLDIKELFNTVMGLPLTTFSVGGICYQRKRVGELNTEEFIQFEKALSNKVAPEIEVLMSLLTGFIPNSKTYLHSKLKKKLGIYDIEFPTKDIEIDRKKIMEDIPYSFGMITVYQIVKELNELKDEFPTLFNMSREDNTSDFDESIFGEFECEEENEDVEAVTLQTKWGWYNIVNEICNDDIMQKDIWYEKPIREFITHVCYTADKGREQTNIQ